MGVALGPFWLNRCIAAGRTAEVWTGVHRGQGVQVAVKFLTVGRRSAAVREVFTREVEILAGLDHPNIVRIWDHGIVPAAAAGELGGKVREGAPYLVMEQGRATLGDRKDVLPWARARRVAWDLLTALAHAHANGVLHRDIKPANILLCPAARRGEKDRVVLTDFGFASAPGEETAFVGLTPGFAAPEQLSFTARAEGPWTDLFALGCVLWRLLTGKSPYDTASVEQAIALQGKPLPKLDGLEPRVDAWLRGLLSVNPALRPSSAAEALRLLASAESGAPPAEVPVDWRVPDVHHPGPRNLSGAGLGLVGIRSGSVGREDVKDRLWASFRQAAAGRTAVVVLHGVEGMGKTHLARWMATVAHERWGGEEWIVSGTKTATEGLVASFRRRLALDGVDAREGRARIGQWLDQTGGQGLFEARSVARQLDPSGAGPDRWASLADLLRRATRRAPLVLRLDDAHTLPDAVALAAWLAEERPDLPLLVVLARTEPGWGARGRPTELLPPRAVDLALPPLAAVLTDRLVGEHLGLAPALRGAVASACGGNPGVAQRMLRRFANDGSLSVDEDGRWQRKEPIDGPGDAELAAAAQALSEFLAGRPEADRSMIELAAVLGAEVSAAELRSAERPGGVRVDPNTVRDLLDDGLWRVTRDGWAFVDARVADAARREAQRAGRWIRWNEVAAGALATVPGGAAQIRRGEHLARAGHAADAVGPWRRGLEARLDEQPSSRTSASLEQFAHTLARLGLPASDPLLATPAELEVQLAFLGGDYARATRLAGVLSESAQGRWPDARSLAMRFLGAERAEALDVGTARRWAAGAVAVAVRPEVRSLALLAHAEVELLGGQVEVASSLLRDALAAAAGFGLAEGRVLLVLARITATVGRRTEARTLVQRAAAAVERTGRGADAWALRELLGRMAMSRGEADVATSHLETVRAAWSEAGQAEAARRVAVPLAGARLAAGDWPGADAACVEAAGSPSAAVRAGALAGRVAVAAHQREPALLDQRLGELTAALGAVPPVLGDVGDHLLAAARALRQHGDDARADLVGRFSSTILGALHTAGAAR